MITSTILLLASLCSPKEPDCGKHVVLDIWENPALIEAPKNGEPLNQSIMDQSIDCLSFVYGDATVSCYKVVYGDDKFTTVKNIVTGKMDTLVNASEGDE